MPVIINDFEVVASPTPRPKSKIKRAAGRAIRAAAAAAPGRSGAHSAPLCAAPAAPVGGLRNVYVSG